MAFNIVRRYALFFLMLIMGTSLFAQEHLTYLGVPIDGNKAKMIANWKKKGLVVDINGEAAAKYKGIGYKFYLENDGTGFSIIFDIQDNYETLKNVWDSFVKERVDKPDDQYDVIYGKHLKTYMKDGKGVNAENPREEQTFYVQNDCFDTIGAVTLTISFPHDHSYGYFLFIDYVDYQSCGGQKPIFAISQFGRKKWYDFSRWVPSVEKLEICSFNKSQDAAKEQYILSVIDKHVVYTFYAEDNDMYFLNDLFANRKYPEISRELLSLYIQHILNIARNNPEPGVRIFTEESNEVYQAYYQKLKSKEDALLAKKQRGRKLFEILFGNYLSKDEYDLIDKYLPSVYIGTIFKGGKGNSGNSESFLKQAEFATKQELNMH